MNNNPIAQVAQMYGLIEAHLRRAATHDIPLTLPALNKQGDIKAIAKSGWQVRDLLKSLVRKGFVIHDTHGYVWNMQAPPFVIGNRSLQRTRTEPSEPKVQRIVSPKPSLDKMQGLTMPQLKSRNVKPAKDIELVIGDTLVVIGRNPVTQRLRITIEDVGD